MDFSDATDVFLDPFRLEREDTRHDYGEARFVTIGQVNRRILTVVYTERGESVRLISARRATLRETNEYHGEPS